MEKDDAIDAGQGAAQEFVAEAMRLRCSAQKQYAQNALDRLYEIAMNGDSGSVQVSALRELLEQLLGRPIPPVAPPAKQDEDALAVIAALGAQYRQKLDRIALSGGSEKSDERSD